MSARHSSGRWWRWPLLTVFAAAYALLFGEFFLRLMASQALVPRYVTGGLDGVRANIPDVAFRQWTPEVDVTIRYNDAGQRDDRLPPGAKKPGECRIALLGDSYFVGFESSFADSFARQLELALQKRGHDCRTVNFAVSGFGHGEMLRILPSRVSRYQPDVLLVSVHQTDGYDNIRANLFRDDGERLVDTGRNYLPGIGISDRLNQYRLYRWAQENSHLYSAAREWAGTTGKKLLAMLRMESPTEVTSIPEGLSPPDDLFPDWVGNRHLNGQILLTMAREAEAMHARLLLLEIPSSRRRRYFDIMDRLIPDAVLQQIPHTSPLDSFRTMASPATKLYLERGMRHWTPLGNRVAADVAADALIADGLLPDAAPATVAAPDGKG